MSTETLVAIIVVAVIAVGVVARFAGRTVEPVKDPKQAEAA